MYLCLDLSSSCTGWAKFSRDGKLLKFGRIIPDEKLDPFFRLHYVVNKVRELFTDAEDLVIEGIFLGRFKGKANVTTFEYLAKLSGAVIYAWISEKYKIPRIYKATEARKLAGLKGTCQKAEVQMWVIRQHRFSDDHKIGEWQKIMNDLNDKYLAKDISNSQFKYRAGKLSRTIGEATGIGEDIADSIVLGKAFKCER
jgi:Holliday junction resolvasome RuvABC endonuclease subunit